MKKELLLAIFIAPLLFCAIDSQAEVRLPSIIGNHMVLQQKSDVNLWGWCSPGEKITVINSWDTTKYVTKGTPGAKWSLKIKTPSAGGPYTITINTKTVLEDVLIGEVWVCGGQSNMEWSGDQKLKQSLDEAPNAANTQIRFFYVPKATADYPQEDIKAKWMVCTPEEMVHFSAIGYFFGKKIQSSLNVPVGLINSNWGGTPAEVWTPKEVVEQDPVLKDASLKLNPTDWWPITPGASYLAMISPLTKFKIAGAIWYQGESNTQNYNTYSRLMTKMIGAWRSAWSNNFPFYYVQIAPFSYGNYNVGALIREQQTACLSIPKTGMVVVHDLVDDVGNIHPVKKIEVANRLANLALADNYGVKEVAYKYPMYKGMIIEKNRVRILFDNVESGLMATSKDLNEFYIAGSDQKFLFASARIEGNTVVVWNKAVKEPVAVRFGFSNNTIPNLFNKEGMPVNMFRTDHWEVKTDAVVK
ncbi:MAG: sialate O-acetylesterase [Prolixibacteraceae bacterium]|jgi:sialate O-acetylesterase|nr:sialate O-acetylesterase [Prolixibacteraceae bacterium]